MELLDFLRLRSKWLALLFVVGIILILLVGHSSGQKDYRATVQMLVRPASDQTAYSNDPDRYVATEMRLMYRPEVLNKAAQSAKVSFTQLNRSLSFAHASGSDTVKLTVTNASRSAAVASVNAVAEAYLADAKTRDDEPFAARAKTLQGQIDSTAKSLTAVNKQIAVAGTAYAAANPDRPNSNPSLLSPEETSKALVLQSKLQYLSSQQTQAAVTGAPEFQSVLLRAAKSAVRPAGWGLTTYLAAIVGWLLVLLAGAGVLVTLSNRVIGLTRWNNVASGLFLAKPIPFRRAPSTDRRTGLNRLTQVMQRNRRAEAATVFTFTPVRTPAISKAMKAIEGRLADGGDEVREVDSIDEAVGLVGAGSDGGAGESGLVFLLVDVGRCKIGDVESLGDFPQTVQRRIVPVLV